jgi:hypothetical protein
MEQVRAGETSEQRSLLDHPSLSGVTLRGIFESEEVGLFHMTLGGAQRVRVGHERLLSIVLCSQGSITLNHVGRERILEVDSYLVVPEGEACELVADPAGAQALVFIGFEQLPGAFFNSYASANV